MTEHTPSASSGGSNHGLPWVTATTIVPVGDDVRLIDVEAVAVSDRPGLLVTGPDGQVLHETRDRLYAAILNAGLSLPPTGMHVRIPEQGRHERRHLNDLALAATILVAAGHLPAAALTNLVLIGELGLDGSLRPVRAASALAAAAHQRPGDTVVVPPDNDDDLTPGPRVVTIASLGKFVDWAAQRTTDTGVNTGSAVTASGPHQPLPRLTAASPKQNEVATLAVQVAAAGGHHLSVTGPTGSGTLMLPLFVAAVLPDLDHDAADEVTALHAIAGPVQPSVSMLRRPPVQTPPCTSSLNDLVGAPERPGIVSLAHRGVLVLHDAPQFDPTCLQALRRILVSGNVTLARSRSVVTYPARFQLILTARPCPCDAARTGDAPCCTPMQRRGYHQRMSLLESGVSIRITLQGDAPALWPTTPGPQVVATVAAARNAAAARWAPLGYRTNAEVPQQQLFADGFRLGRAAGDARRLMESGDISSRGYARLVRMAWTIADLNGAERPDRDAVDTARRLYLGIL